MYEGGELSFNTLNYRLIQVLFTDIIYSCDHICNQKFANSVSRPRTEKPRNIPNI